MRNYAARIEKLEARIREQRDSGKTIRVSAIGITRAEFRLRYLSRLLEVLKDHEKQNVVRVLISRLWQMITSASDWTERLQATELAKKVEKAVEVHLRQPNSKRRLKMESSHGTTKVALDRGGESIDANPFFPG